MVAGTPDGPIWRRLGNRPALLAAAGAIAALAVIFVPAGREGRIVKNPAADARQAYLSLLSQMDSSGAAPSFGGEAGAAETIFASSGRSRLERDLFAPSKELKLPTLKKAPAPTRAAPRAEAPKLSAVFVGTGAPMAVLSGRAVGEGDEVNGYRVVRIVADGVILEKDGSLLALRPGGKS
ncbi:MAG: hypothetical protein ABIK65_04405 [Candidatus Eisenbacteria bacterium]